MPIQVATLPAQRPVALPNGTVIQVDRPAQVTQWTSGRGGLRAAVVPAEVDVTEQWTRALAQVGILEQETLHVDVRSPESSVFRSAAAWGRDEIVIRPAAATAGLTPGVTVVFYQDESGGLSWHFPDGFVAQPGAAPAFRGVEPAPVFTIPARSRAAQAVLATRPSTVRMRGPITKIGRKIFKVLFIPLVDRLLAKPIQLIVGEIEEHYRKDNIRVVTPDNYSTAVSDAFTDWASLARGRTLLIVHGILSTTEGMLSQAPRAAMEELHAHYNGRVIAMDQLTVSQGPEHNARFFLERMQAAAPEGGIDFDILCHSRGGVVARTLAERGQSLVPGHKARFGKVFFVASPNRGSRLADADHMLDMIDVFTNFITNFPDGPVSYSIEVLLGVLKALAHTAERNLPGVAAMSTTGYIAETLNVPGEKSPAAYACATADYTPDPARDNAFFAGPIGDRIMDAVFTDRGTREANDLIVPSDGVWAENRHPSFPIQMRHSFGKSDHVWHTGFFAKKETFGWIKRHFEIGAQAQVKAVRSPPQSAPVFRQPSAPIARAPVFRSALPEAAPASAPGNAAAVTLRRQPTMKFPGLVEAGSTSDLEVNLVEVAATSAATNVFSVLLEAGVDALTLDVLVDAPGFEMVGAASGQVTLRRVRDAQLEKVAFRLTALAAGNEPVTREIRVDFLLGNSIVGSVRQRATVIPAGYAGARDGAGGGSVVEISIAEQRRDDCDLVIFVDSDDEHAKPPFRIRLRCTIPGQAYGLKKAGSVDLDRDVGSFVETTLQSVFDSVPQPQAGEDAVAAWDAWKGVFNSTLDALGKSLWDLLPKAFRDEYFRLVDLGAAPKSILVHSDEMVLPWELVIPYDERHPDMEPLGRAHVIGRWRTDLQARPMQQRLRVNRFCVLNPTYAGANALPWSVAEAQKLQQRFSRATLIAPASLPGVQQSLLGQTDVQLVHFTGHAEFNPANAALSSLLLENAKLPALLLTGSALLQKAQPVIYLNGCNAGQTGFAAGRPGGFAAVLLQGGCSGLIAPHWPVEDQSATAFSLALYEKLGFGRAIGEALQELRREHADDPTFRAFTYFGDPWTRLNLMGVT